MLERPLTLPSGAVLANRIAKASMSEGLADPDGLPNERHLRLYERWGKSGAGLLLTGNVQVDPRYLESAGNVVLEEGTPLEPFGRWAKAASLGGAALWMQIAHPGRQTPLFIARTPLAPSAVPAVKMMGSFGKPRALEEREIEDLVARFARTAALAKDAGFAGAQLHGAHGYLISQFLSPLTNLRTDRWGGPLEGRARFLMEAFRATRAAVGPAFPIGVKLNSADFQRGGFGEEESLEVVRMLEAAGADLIEISGGNYESPEMFVPAKTAESTRAREAYFLEFAAKVRAASKIPLMVTGGFRTRAGMEAALASGALDVIGLARPMALEPDLPARLLDGKSDASTARPRRTGVKKIDVMAEAGFYGAQIERMARGAEPDPGVGPWRATAWYLRNSVGGGLRLRRARAKAA